MKTQQKILITIVSLILAACGKQEPMSVKQQEFQKNSQQALDQYARKLSNALTGQSSMRGVTTNGRGIDALSYAGLGGFSSYTGTQFQIWPGSVVPQRADTLLQQCATYVGTIQPVHQNYSFAMATLARCLNVGLQNRNPISWANSQMDPYGLYALGYSVDSVRVAPYGAHNDYYGLWGNFMTTGLLSGGGW
jgi:hypothetical protein